MRIGIIGCGLRATGFFRIMKELDLGVRLASIADPDRERAKETLVEKGLDTDGAAFYADADEMLDRERLDGVIIGTRCSLHTAVALKVLRRNLPLFLEKPVATNMKDLLTLKSAAEASKSPVVISFPLRATPLAQLAKEIVLSGKLGAIEHVQAVNNVAYGGIYFHGWYRNEDETGGLFLQKATHDFDCINYILDRRPVMICAMKSKQIFKGEKPSGLLCRDCDERDTCPEGPFVMKHIKNDTAYGDMCCFAEDTGNEDSGSALIKYETGMHIAYSQNFFARKAAGRRSVRLFGYNGTLEFDWTKRRLEVFMHDTSRTETYSFDSGPTLSHGGGDGVLALNFIRVIQGRAESIAPVSAGLLSALMCLKARESAEKNTFERIEW